MKPGRKWSLVPRLLKTSPERIVEREGVEGSGRHGTTMEETRNHPTRPRQGCCRYRRVLSSVLKREDSNNLHERGVAPKTKSTFDMVIGQVHQWGFISVRWGPSIVEFGFCLGSFTPLFFNAIGAYDLAECLSPMDGSTWAQALRSDRSYGTVAEGMSQGN